MVAGRRALFPFTDVNLCELSKPAKADSHFEYEAGSIETLRRMVELNDGITILPELATMDFCKNNALIRHFKKPAPMREVSMVVHTRFCKETARKNSKG